VYLLVFALVVWRVFVERASGGDGSTGQPWMVAGWIVSAPGLPLMFALGRIGIDWRITAAPMILLNAAIWGWAITRLVERVRRGRTLRTLPSTK
jgi:hypothetical protein